MISDSRTEDVIDEDWDNICDEECGEFISEIFAGYLEHYNREERTRQLSEREEAEKGICMECVVRLDEWLRENIPWYFKYASEFEEFGPRLVTLEV